MDLLRFNKWTQYLQRDILLELCKQHADHIDNKNPEHDQLRRVIANNRGFDLAKYSQEFPNADWIGYVKSIPLSCEEVSALIYMNDPETLDEPDAYNMRCEADEITLICRATEQQIREIDERKFDVVTQSLIDHDIERIIPFVYRYDIPLDIIARILSEINITLDGDRMVLREIACRRDMTVTVAKRIYELVQMQDDYGDGDPDNPCSRNEIRRVLAYNSALSVEQLYEICGAIPEIVLNQSFGLHHADDPRFEQLIDDDHGYISGNYNFGIPTGVMINVTTWYMNPRFDAAKNTDDDDWHYDHMAFVQNEYTKNPHWNAECRRLATRRNNWLALICRVLTKRLPREIVEHVLEIWYSPVKF